MPGTAGFSALAELVADGSLCLVPTEPPPSLLRPPPGENAVGDSVKTWGIRATAQLGLCVALPDGPSGQGLALAATAHHSWLFYGPASESCLNEGPKKNWKCQESKFLN